MTSYPLKKIYVTQKWGNDSNGNPYSKFGYLGHNGLDLRLHDGDGTKLYAPHDGVVKERRYDADGYGNYLKIESSIEGSILAHLKGFEVNINKQVKQGDLIGYCDNTGWSTGHHLHWGYYQTPRDRTNGYGGTIDPTPHIQTNTMTDTDCQKQVEALKLSVDNLQAEVEKKNEHINNYVKQVDGKNEEIQHLKIALEEERDGRRTDLQDIAESIPPATDTVTSIRTVQKQIIIKAEASQKNLDKATESELEASKYKLLHKEALKTIADESGRPVGSNKGIINGMKSYCVLMDKLPPNELDDYTNIIKLAGVTLWLRN